MRGRKFLFGELVTSRLIFGYVVILRNDFEFIEGATIKRRLGHHSADTERRGRHEPNLVASAGQVVLGILDSVVAEVADLRLAAATKRKQVSANLFELGPTCIQRPDAYDETGDSRIVAGRVNCVDVIVK